MKKQKVIDPHAEREAQKYVEPIPSREYILEFLRKRGRPARREELIEALQLATPETQEALRKRLRAMERDGQLILTRRGGYGLVDKMNLVCGRVVGHKDGFGFVIPDDGSDDLFLNARYMRAVFHNDRVLVRVSGVDHKGRREAAIVEVLEHRTHSLVGRFSVERGIALVIPDNKRITQDILIPLDQQNNAQQGQIVVAEIVQQPNLYQRPVGRVIEILGEHMAPGMEITTAIYNYGIPHKWPQEVSDEIATLQEQVLEHDKKDRTDLRSLSFVTIDGEDAKDFDDAVYCKRRSLRGGWVLYVAIADVSHYVQPHTALDLEALNRGNSVYFPGEVIPMLPEILSNGLCSLKPNVDRLCFVCEMVISSAGKLSSYRFYPAVIHSQARLTYTQVADILQNSKSKYIKQYKILVSHLQELEKLYLVLHETREIRGAIDFETIETRVIFGEKRKIEQIVPVERNIAHRIIEECMLMANVSAARFLEKHKLPGLYRIHAGPTAEKLQDLRDFLSGLGLSLPGGENPKPADYAELLRLVKDRPDAHLIQTVMLRSLSQAIYSPDNSGHFGLAYSAYTHFTSPIRRYPDLLLHRALRHGLAGGKAENFFCDHAAMVNFGEHTSITERRADEATRDALDWLKCEFMSTRLGEEFDGIITGVTSFGLFVELRNIYIEGLVHVTALNNDYYHYDPIRHHLRGERTGTIYRLGDKARIQVARVDLESRQIDFDLVRNKGMSNKNKKNADKKTAAKRRGR